MRNLQNCLISALLLFYISFCPSFLFAQESISTAEALSIGSNVVSFAAESDYQTHKYFSFTADKTGLLRIEGATSSASFMAVNESGEEISYLHRAAGCIVPLRSGEKVWIAVSPAMIMETEEVCYFNASFTENDNAGRGTSSSDPIVVRDNETNVVIDTAPGFVEFKSYFTYTAEKDGALELSCSAYVLSARFGDSFSHMSGSFSTSYRDGIYVGSLPVEAGKTVCFCLSTYEAMTIKAEMTYPERGTSANYPITAIIGENEVSAEFGTYWYRYNGAEKDGYVEITSEYDIPRGYVQVYTQDLSSLVASSQTGSYNVRFKVSAGVPYLIYIYKPEESEEWPDPDLFTLSFQELKQGESANNPIALTPNVTSPMDNAIGTYYYALTIPADGEGKMIDISLSGSGVNSSMLTLYDQQLGLYYGISGYGRVTMPAHAKHAYMLIVDKQEYGQVEILPLVRDMVSGEDILKPIVAQIGTNVVSKASDVYYQYQATLDGRIAVSFDIPGITAEFPIDIDASLGAYKAISFGSQTKIDVVKGKTYYIHLRNVSEDCKMILSENEYHEGEVQSMAIEMQSPVITLGAGMFDVWYKYIVPSSGKMTISADFIGDINTFVYYCTDSNPSPYSISNSNEDGDVVYSTQFPVHAGETVYVHIVTPSERIGSKITCLITDFAQGETITAPYILHLGKTLEVPVSTRTMAHWICVPVAGNSKVRIFTDRFASGGVYTSTDTSHGYDLEFTADENNEVCTAIYESESPVENLYVCLTQSYGTILLSAVGEGSAKPDAIESVYSEDASAGVYQITGIRTNGMKRGINIVRMQDGSVHKVIMK